MRAKIGGTFTRIWPHPDSMAQICEMWPHLSRTMCWSISKLAGIAGGNYAGHEARNSSAISLLFFELGHAAGVAGIGTLESQCELPCSEPTAPKRGRGKTRPEKENNTKGLAVGRVTNGGDRDEGGGCSQGGPPGRGFAEGGLSASFGRFRKCGKLQSNSAQTRSTIALNHRQTITSTRDWRTNSVCSESAPQKLHRILQH